jgi:hypothetical protein
MTSTNKSKASSEGLEDMFSTVFHRVEDTFRGQWAKLEDKVRDSPTTAVLIAAGIGYCIHRLPVRSLLATQLKLLWALAPPAVVAAAAGKAYQVLDERLHSDNGQSRAKRSEGAPAVL